MAPAKAGSGTFSLLFVAITWGTMIPGLNLLLHNWDPFFLAAARYVFAAPVLWLFLLLLDRNRRTAVPVPAWRLWLLGAIGIGSFAPLFTIGVAHANPVTAAIIVSTGPAVGALVAWLFFRIPLDPAMIPAIVLAILGCSLATYDPKAASHGFEIRGGEFLMILGSVCWSWYSLAAQRWLQGWSQIRIAAATTTTGSVATLAVYVIAGLVGAAHLPPALPSSWQDAAILTWIAVVLVAVGLIAWNHGVNRSGVVVALIYLNMMPVVAIAITALLGTPPRPFQIIGGALVIAGVLQSQLRRLRTARPAPLPGEEPH
jgi:drug/metabolite transporter (DMT)-like permease